MPVYLCMNWDKIKTLALPAKLPGFEAYKSLNLQSRPLVSADLLKDKTLRKAAVLVLLVNAKEPYILLTERNNYKGVHGGQVSFPGGKKEPYDLDYETTAFREANEETGVLRSDVQLLGPLSPIYIPPSHFYVQPFIGIAAQEPLYTLEEREVKRLIKMPITYLLENNNLGDEVINRADFKLKVKGWHLDSTFVWGATACILMELKAILEA